MFVSYKLKIGVSLALLTLFVGFGWIAFPLFFKKLVEKNISLAPKSQTREMWQAFPFPFDFSIHVLNVTNPVEILNGAKPVVNDIGPFVFDEFKDKYDLQDNDEDDTVSFNMRNTYIFRPDKSSGLTGEELITMPHPLIQIMAISVKRANPDVIGVIAQGLKIIFNNASPFLTAPFMDLFFRGVFIDCSHEDIPAKAVCSQFDSGTVKGIKKVNATHFTFTLMGGNNHTNDGRFTVLRGIKNTKSLAKVIRVNGKTHLGIWPGDECNKLKGTDGTIFPPFLNSKLGIWSHSAELCRSLSLRPAQSVRYAGLPAQRFVMDFGDIENEEENRCFCLSYPSHCPVKGTMDLSPCTKTPMVASMPHFLHGDEGLLRNIEGLEPTSSLHGTYVDFEIISGTPLSVYKRMQFNLDVEPVAEVSGMENLRPVVMPMFWIEESINLTPPITDELKKMFKMITINDVFKWSALVVTVVGFAVVIYVKNAQDKRAVVPAVD